MRLAQRRVQLLRLLQVLRLRLLRLLLLCKRAVRGLLVQVDARERVLRERLVDLGVDEVGGMQGLLFLLLNCILGGRGLSGGLGVGGEVGLLGPGNLSLRLGRQVRVDLGRNVLLRLLRNMRLDLRRKVRE